MNLRRSSVLIATAALVAATPALAGPVQFSVETTARLGYDLNPFLSTGNDLASPYAQASVQPKLSKTTEKGTLNLSGYYDRTEYLKHYGGNDAFGGEFQAAQRLTPKLSVFAGLSYDNEVIGQGRDDSVTSAGVDDTDINLIGQRNRAQTLRATAGYSYQISSKDTITGNAGYSITDYRGSSGNDSKTISGGFGVQHAISPRTKIGVRATAYRIDYDTPGLSTMILQPTVTFSTKLSTTWSLDASLGMSFSSLTLPIVPDEKTSGLAGSLTLCHKGTKNNLCIYADRSVSASGIGGSQERTQIGVSFRQALTEKLAATWDGSYARSASQANILGTRQYVSGRAGLDWAVGQDFKIGAAGIYRDIYGRGVPIKADIGGELYATLTLPGRK